VDSVVAVLLPLEPLVAERQFADLSADPPLSAVAVLPESSLGAAELLAPTAQTGAET